MLLFILHWFLLIIFLIKFCSIITKGYCTANVCLVGKTAIVTGGNSGMGFLVSMNLASRGCRVIIADVVDGTESVKKIIEQTGNYNVIYMPLDLSSFASVRKFAANVIANEKSLDILINNAGTGGFRNKTEDGIYKVLQINYLGHFLLTTLLCPLMKATKNARVVFVSSFLALTHNLSDGSDINKFSTFSKHADVLNTIYDYGNSKICMLAATNIFAKKLEKAGIIVSACHPGLVRTPIFNAMHTNMKDKNIIVTLFKAVVDFTVYFLGKSAFEGIQSTLHCALEPNIKSGSYILDCANFFMPPKVNNEKFCENVWQESVRLAKLTKDEELQ